MMRKYVVMHVLAGPYSAVQLPATTSVKLIADLIAQLFGNCQVLFQKIPVNIVNSNYGMHGDSTNSFFTGDVFCVNMNRKCKE